MSPEILDILLTALRDSQQQRNALAQQLAAAKQELANLKGEDGDEGGNVRRFVKRSEAN